MLSHMERTKGHMGRELSELERAQLSGVQVADSSSEPKLEEFRLRSLTAMV